MPPEPSLEDELFGPAPTAPAAVPSLEDELFGAAPLLQEGALASPEMEEAVEAQPPEAPRELRRPQNEDPWYTNAFRDIGAPATFTENLASGSLANTPDEIGAAAIGGMTADTSERPEQIQGYQGIQPEELPREYAAGSQFEDNRNTLEQEKLERDETSPTAATTGQVGGGLLQAAALPQAATSTALGGLASGVGLTAANYMGSASGDIGERAEQAAATAEEHPFSTIAATAIPAVVGGLGGEAARAAPVLAEKSAINRTAAVMTPNQRSVHMDNFGGKPSLVRLGNDMENAKLHLRDPESSGWWPSNWMPGSAETVHTNAVNLRSGAGKRLGAAEEQILGANPAIQVGGIAKDLRAGADDLTDSWRGSAPAEMSERRGLADRIDRSTQQAPIPGAEGPELPVSDVLPFQQAVKQRRGLDAETNFTKAGGVENAGIKEQIARQTGSALRKNIRTGLDDAAVQNPLLEQPVKDWNKANKDFSLASTVEDPAQLAMNKEYGGTLGLRDMATSTAAQALGIPGPLAAGAGAVLKGGKAANALAGTQKNLSKAFGAFGTSAGPTALATTQAALPDPEVKKAKNEDMKEQLSSWFSSLLTD